MRVQPRRDARWLLVARHPNAALHFLAKIISGEPDDGSYIAGGVMEAQSLAELAPSKSSCGKDDPAVTSITLNINEKTDDATGVVTIENDAEDVQFVVYVAGPISGGSSYGQVTVSRSQTMAWKAGLTAGSLVDDRSTARTVLVSARRIR